ncbi:tRNA synthetases class I-domain-containing protein [Pelagophyceae sp. CCMP2097]|nr:tRNA synthetases class I-domain-containing protein [Pelagophyceae sp. CCMP2097]
MSLPRLDEYALIYAMAAPAGAAAAVDPAVEALAVAVTAAGDAVKSLKAAKAAKPEVEAAVQALLAAKAALTAADPTHALVGGAKKAEAAPAAVAEEGGEKKISKKEQKRAARGEEPAKKKDKDPNRWAVDPEKAAAKAQALLDKAAAAAAVEEDPDAIAPPTVLGERKKLAKVMTKTYDPAAVEASWQEYWEAAGHYGCDAKAAALVPKERRFTMVIPPPNVTGSLHLGHALTAAIEDGLTRWHRMRGDATLYVPGTDHAGIATQSVVEKQLAKLKPPVSRHDLGRDKFLEKVWEWKEQYGSRIYKQLRRLGSSVDWSRERFTMDSTCAAAVTEAFAKLHENGRVYRANRLVNWSSALKSAISDLEVDHVELEGRTWRAVPGHSNQPTYEFGTFTSFAYKVIDAAGAYTGEEVVVATTRLETMLGDPAVAVHPEDARYKHLHGARLRHPFFPEREMKVVTDSILVDMEKGTGCVKITPAHDANDYECGKRHGLPFVTIFTLDGAVVQGVDFPTASGESRFEAMPAWAAGEMRYDVRVTCEAELEKLGLLRGKEGRAMRLAICSRSGDIIEPLVQPQWFVDCGDMAARACEAVRSGELVILPKEHEKTWFSWLENIRPWCVSRQLWWGHRIPAWFCRLASDRGDGSADGLDKNADANVERWIVARNEEEALVRAMAKFQVSADQLTLEQDEDVLDTWFSSGLFPFSVFGWPNKNDDMKAFFPTTLLETGLDILFFWVARMVMMGLELTDLLPFKTVYLHAMVRDKEGRKMSKSLGNVIDPLEVIDGCTLENLLARLQEGNLRAGELEKASAAHKDDFPTGIPKCGSDALRIGLLAYTVQGRDINLDIKRVVGYRSFCNKLWNATRFMLGNFADDFKPTDSQVWMQLRSGSLELQPRDKFMLSRIAYLAETMNAQLEAYTFGEAVATIYQFFLADLCDVYVEVVKPLFRSTDPKDDGKKKATSYVLWAALDCGLRCLHPFCPFVTEELWQRLPRPAPPLKSIMVSPYPEISNETIPASFRNVSVEAATKVMLDCVSAARALKAQYNLNKPADFLLLCKDAAVAAAVLDHRDDFAALTKAKSFEILAAGTDAPAGCAASVVDENVTVLVNLSGLVDVALELKKLKKQVDDLAPLLSKLTAKLVDPKYLEKAPQSQVDQDELKRGAYQDKMDALLAGMANWSNMA